MLSRVRREPPPPPRKSASACAPLPTIPDPLTLPHQWQDLFYESRYSGTEMMNPDFALLATAMGGRGLTVTTEADLPAVMADFLWNGPNTPTLLNAVCDPDEHVYPMVPAGSALDKCIISRPAK